MVFGGKFRIRRCNSKASYLPRQSLDKLNTTDPDHGSYKLTLTSNEDCVSQLHSSGDGHGGGGGNKNATTKVFDIMVNGGGGGAGKINNNNLPDVLPVGAKRQHQHHHQQQQSSSPTTSVSGGGGGSATPLRYASSNSLQQTSLSSPLCYPPSPSPLSTSPLAAGMKHLQQQHTAQHHHPSSRHSTPLMGNFASPPSAVAHNNYNRSQSHDAANGNVSVSTNPLQFMSQSAVDLKKSQILEVTTSSSSSLSPSPAPQSEGSHQQQQSSSASLSPVSARRQFHNHNDINNRKMSPVQRAAAANGPDEGRIVRAELVNTILSTSPNGGGSSGSGSGTGAGAGAGANRQVIRKNSLRENIEKITQLQSKLMSAHIAESGLLGCYPLTKPKEPAAPSPTQMRSSVESKNALGCNKKEEKEEEDEDDDEADDKHCKSVNEPQSRDDDVDVPTMAMDSTMDDGLKRSEIILRVIPPPTMVEVGSQTDETLDNDVVRLIENNTSSSSSSSSSKDDALIRTTLQPRQVHPIEIDCDKLTKDLANMLPPTDKLIQILVPKIIKSSSDYVCNLYNPNVPLRPAKRDVGTSTLARKPKDTAAATAAVDSGCCSAVELQFTEIAPGGGNLMNGGPNHTDGCDLIKRKVEELIEHLSLKLKILNTEQTMIGDETTINDELGSNLANKLIEKIRPIDATKFRTYIDDVGHITSLLLSLSGRLAKVENLLSSTISSGASQQQNNNNNNNSQEMKMMLSKRDRLIEQLEEAKRLKEDIDRRGLSVGRILENNLSSDEYADYDFFVNMKAKLIADSRNVTDKIKCAEEQVTALSEALIQSDC